MLFMKAYPKTAGDCPDFAQSARFDRLTALSKVEGEQNGTVPFSEAVFG